MSLQLHRVEWSGCCYVLAENHNQALAIAESAALAYSTPEVGIEAAASALPVEHLAQVDHEWRGRLPFGADPAGERTIAEILNSATTIPAPGPSYSASGTPPADAE